MFHSTCLLFRAPMTRDQKTTKKLTRRRQESHWWPLQYLGVDAASWFRQITDQREWQPITWPLVATMGVSRSLNWVGGGQVVARAGWKIATKIPRFEPYAHKGFNKKWRKTGGKCTACCFFFFFFAGHSMDKEQVDEVRAAQRSKPQDLMVEDEDTTWKKNISPSPASRAYHICIPV